MKLNYDFLPTYLQEIIKKLGDVYQIDSDYALTGLMMATAASQGDRLQIVDPKGYRNALSCWLIQIGISGYGKSECASWLMEPLLSREELWHNEFKKEYANWENQDMKDRGLPPIEKKFILNDYTPEALFDAMEKAGADGILLYRDEISGWMKDIGRYGKSGEVEQYLTAWSQKSVGTARLGRPSNLTNRPCFNVFGGIQPDILQEMLGKRDLIMNGFNSRILFVFEDDKLSLKYFRESVPESMKVAYKDLMDRLLRTPSSKMTFSVSAEDSFIRFWEDLQLRKTRDTGMNRQLLSKLQIYVEKWAGIIELLTNDGSPSKEISGNSMEIAISHIRAFEEWAKKAYSYIMPEEAILELSKANLKKSELLEQLVKNYPNMNKNIVAKGLGIARSGLSRSPKRACPLEDNTENELTN